MVLNRSLLLRIRQVGTPYYSLCGRRLSIIRARAHYRHGPGRTRLLILKQTDRSPGAAPSGGRNVK